MVYSIGFAAEFTGRINTIVQAYISPGILMPHMARTPARNQVMCQDYRCINRLLPNISTIVQIPTIPV